MKWQMSRMKNNYCICQTCLQTMKTANIGKSFLILWKWRQTYCNNRWQDQDCVLNFRQVSSGRTVQPKYGKSYNLLAIRSLRVNVVCSASRAVKRGLSTYTYATHTTVRRTAVVTHTRTKSNLRWQLTKLFKYNKTDSNETDTIIKEFVKSIKL